MKSNFDFELHIFKREIGYYPNTIMKEYEIHYSNIFKHYISFNSFVRELNGYDDVIKNVYYIGDVDDVKQFIKNIKKDGYKPVDNGKKGGKKSGKKGGKKVVK